MAKASKAGQPPRKSAASKGNGANLGFEAKLWQGAGKLRNNVDVAAIEQPEDAKLATQATTIRLSSCSVLQIRKQSHALAHRH